MEVARESIFVSALRTFCRMFFAIAGILLAFLLFSLLYSAASPSPLLEEKTELHILPNIEGNRDLVVPSAPVLLQINVHGVIGDPKTFDTEILENILIDSRNGLLRKDRVKGILLHFNTPGGTVVDSDNIYHLLKAYKEKYKVPIFGYVEGLCASGGMYIASAADQIFAGPASIVGSVGVVIGPFLNVYDLLQKVGIQARTLTQGIDKDMMNPTRPWREGEDASLNAVSAFLYERFVRLVTEARPRLDKRKLVEEYGAKIFDCVEGEKLGYVDHALSSRDEALKALAKEADVDIAKSYQVVELSPRRNWLAGLISEKSPLFTGKIEHSLDIGQPKIYDPFAYLFLPSYCH